MTVVADDVHAGVAELLEEPTAAADLRADLELRLADAGLVEGLLEDAAAVRNNHLTELPAAMGRLTKLKHLDLRGNPLKALPDELASLPALGKLDLRWIPSLQRPRWLGELEVRGVLIYL